MAFSKMVKEKVNDPGQEQSMMSAIDPTSVLEIGANLADAAGGLYLFSKLVKKGANKFTEMVSK